MNNILDFLKNFIAYFLSIFISKYKNYWLISERGFDGRDNGYWFYRYMLEHHPEQKVIYCISKKSSDYEKIKELLGEVVSYKSIKHGLIYFTSKCLICTHAYFCSPRWKGLDYLQKRGLLKPKGKKIFLQHGITKDYIEGLTKKKLKADLFICGAKIEYDYIKEKFGYDNEVVYTGFSRFDNLYNCLNDARKNILFMPTWREYIRLFNSEEQFKESRYFKNINALLNNKLLGDFLKEKNIKMLFYPHIEVQKWIKCFNIGIDNVEVCTMENYDVQKLLIDTEILITDYSSVFFDYAYMKKKIYFYQFDYDDYRSTQYKEGYFDYKQGFGPVFESADQLIKRMIDEYNMEFNNYYLEKNCSFFTYRDNKNCDRIYSEIKKVV